MSNPIIEVRNLAKRYRLGSFGARSFRDEWQSFWERRQKNATSNSNLSRDATARKDFWALKDVSFEVQRGEVIGIIGRNGAGKSTLLKILSRITAPTEGEAILHGRVASLLEVGTGFHPELSGRENIFLNGAVLGMKRREIRSKFDEIVAFAEVERFIDTPVKRYSSGMYVRLAFAVAAHLEPEILIVDEVLAVGDAAFQQKCLGKIQDVSTQQGRTVLFVSHHMSAVRRLCRNCILLHQGKASPILRVEDAIGRYHSDFKQEKVGYTVETAGVMRDHGFGTDAKIVRVEAVGVLPLVYGQRLRLNFTLEVCKTLRDVMVGVAFDTPEGARIMTLDSDAGGTLLTLEPGRYVVRIGLDSLALQPGHYVVHGAVGSGGHYFDSLHRFAIWEVLAGQHDHVSDRGFGGCRLIPKVECTKELVGEIGAPSTTDRSETDAEMLDEAEVANRRQCQILAD